MVNEGLIYQISTDDLENLLDKQVGVSTTELSELGYKAWGGRDASGKLTKWIHIDEKARVKELRITDHASNTMIVGNTTYDTGKTTLSKNVLVGNDIYINNGKLLKESVVIGNGGIQNMVQQSERNVSVGNDATYRMGANDSVNVGNNAHEQVASIWNAVENGNINLGNHSTTSTTSYQFHKSQSIGYNALHGASRSSSKSGGKYDVDGKSLWNMIAVGDGAGENCISTSGSGNIFIGSYAGKGLVNVSNSILMGTGCLSGLPIYDKFTEKILMLHERNYKDNAGGFANNKFVVHSNSRGTSALPSMVVALAEKDNQPNPSKFFGPMSNIYGWYEGGTSLILVSGSGQYVSAFGYTMHNNEWVGYVQPSVGQKGTAFDLCQTKNVIISAAEGAFATKGYLRMTFAIDVGVESNITFIGDTKHEKGQFDIVVTRSPFASIWSTMELQWGGTKVNTLHLGDPLYGDDGYGRKIKFSVPSYGSSAGITLVPTFSIEKMPQMIRTPQTKFAPETEPFRYTKGTSKTFSFFWPDSVTSKAGLSSIQVGVRNFDIGDYAVWGTPSDYSFTTDANYVYVTVNSAITAYDEIKIKFVGATLNTSGMYNGSYMVQYPDHIWAISDDNHRLNTVQGTF